MWLLHGKGPKFRGPARDRRETVVGPGVSVGACCGRRFRCSSGARRRPPTLIVTEVRRRAPPAGSRRDVVLLAVDDSTAARSPRLRAPVTSRPGASGSTPSATAACIRIEGDAMSPIVADGAYVAFAKTRKSRPTLDGKMVVAWVDGQPMVRWFQHCGRYAVLRAENPAPTPARSSSTWRTRPRRRVPPGPLDQHAALTRGGWRRIDRPGGSTIPARPERVVDPPCRPDDEPDALNAPADARRSRAGRGSCRRRSGRSGPGRRSP